MDGIMPPVAWTFDKLGRADRMFKGFHQQNLRRLKKANPFRTIIPALMTCS